MMKKLIILLITILSLKVVYAQNSEVRGFLYDKSNGEPLLFSVVFLEGTSYGANTDVNGFYSITKVPAGKYTLIVSSLGFDTIREVITLKENQILTKNLYMSENSTVLEEIEVRGEKIDRKTDVNVGITKITPRQINILPSIGGEADLAQYLQTLPGVVFTGDQGGQLYIRGGAPVQNLALIDGMTVYSPFHSIGLFSVFDTDIMRSVDIFTGGFKADYGGRSSAVIDVTTRDGNKKEFAGKLSVNPFTAKVQLEGPLKVVTDSTAGISCIGSIRNSYLDRSSKTFYSYANDQGQLPFSFSDEYGKLTIQTPSGSKVSVFGFNFNDKANLDSLNDLTWNNLGLGANFLLLPPTSSTILGISLAYSKYNVQISEESSKPRSSEVGSFNFGIDFNYFVGKNELKYGIDMNFNSTDFIAYNPQGKIAAGANEPQDNTELGAFVRYKIVNNRYVIEPSFRVHYYASLTAGKFSPEPRLGIKYNITEWARFKFAGGLFSQNLYATRSDRDVVNLFNGYFSSPSPVDVIDSEGNRVNNTLMKSQHGIFGLEFDIAEYFEVDVEPYVKNFTKLIGVNRDYKIDATYLVESGIAMGVDFQVKYDYNKTYIQVGYSLGSVRRNGLIDGTGIEKNYPTNYDRRHNANVLIAQKFGKDKSWDFSLRWNLGSGFPFTPTGVFYPDYSFASNLDQDLTTANPNLGIKYGVLNSKRLPTYHRMDLSIKKTYKFKNRTELEISGGVINVYNRANLFYFDRVTSNKVNQLPIMPSIGVSYKF